MNDYLMGIDIGTASVKVAVLDSSARVVGIRALEYAIDTPQPGWAQINSKSLWNAFLLCVHALAKQDRIDIGRVAGIGISCLCPGLAAFDADGNCIVEPILYSDRRSVEEAQWINQMVDADEIFAITANNVMAGAISVTSMLWVKRNMPQHYEKSHCFGHVNTLMALWLTGAYGIDYSNASYTGLFETAGGRQWSPYLCEKIGIAVDKLPPLMASHDVVGSVIAEDLIALGVAAGTPVVIGGGDTACASLAVGVTKNGDVCESAGTTNVLTVCVDQPKFDRSFINRCHVVQGTWIYQGALSHTGASLRWFQDEFCFDIVQQARAQGISAFSLMDQMAQQAEPGAGGVVFLPYMLGERSPVWDTNARGVFFGMSLASKRADMVRAVLEGCGYGLRQLLEIARRVTGLQITEFVSIGGGSKSVVWSQIKAEITGARIHVLENNEGAPMGAALLAGVGCGMFASPQAAAALTDKRVMRCFSGNGRNRDLYDARYHVYTQLYPRLKDLF